MTTSFSKKFMLVATLTSALVAGTVGTAQAAPDFKSAFKQTQNPTLVFPALPKHASDIHPPIPGKQIEDVSNHVYNPDHDRWPISGGHRLWRHHDRDFGYNYSWDPDMFAYGYGLYQFPAETCRSLALRLEKRHLPFSEERAILRNRGCAISRVGWN
jgi:hypothetical protein